MNTAVNHGHAQDQAPTDQCLASTLQKLLTEKVAPRIYYRRDFIPKTTPVSQLMGADGEITLFRVIGGKYVRGTTAGEFLSREGSYSYSLNPYIANMWEYYPNRQTNYVVIARQNVLRSELGFPKNGTFNNRLTPRTAIGEISYYDEVKVPIKDENPIAVIPVDEFRRIVNQFKNEAFTIEYLVKKALASPLAETPP